MGSIGYCSFRVFWFLVLVVTDMKNVHINKAHYFRMIILAKYGATNGLEGLEFHSSCVAQPTVWPWSFSSPPLGRRWPLVLSPTQRLCRDASPSGWSFRSDLWRG